MNGGDENTKDFIENFYYILPEYETTKKQIIFSKFLKI